MKNMMRCVWLLLLMVTAALAGRAQSKPNIVLVLMDNLGYGELGAYGGGVLRGAPTPRIDKLASEGLRLLNFNVEAQCTPSRAALMTGRYAIRTGNASVPIDTPRYGLVQWEVTMAEMLSDVGYATGAFGKWHLGHTDGRFPTDQGFDEWFGIPNSSDEAYWPNRSMYRPNSDPYAGPEYVMESVKGQAPKKLQVYDLAYRRIIDRQLTDKTEDFKKPWRVDNDCKDTLDKLSLRLQQMPNGKLDIVGYTNEEESVKEQTLGAQRSVNVKYYLTTDGPNKVDASRVQPRQGGIEGQATHFYFVPEGNLCGGQLEEGTVVDEAQVQPQSRNAPAPKMKAKKAASTPNQ